MRALLTDDLILGWWKEALLRYRSVWVGPYTQSQLDKAPSYVTLPYLGRTSHHIQCILSKHNIKVFHTAPLKIHGMLTSH